MKLPRFMMQTFLQQKVVSLFAVSNTELGLLDFSTWEMMRPEIKNLVYGMHSVICT